MFETSGSSQSAPSQVAQDRMHDGFNQEPVVYVVDDDPSFLRALQRLIESAGLRAELFDSAQSFLDGYDPDRLSCLLLDLRLAGMSGTELQTHIVGQGLQIPIIIITGHADVPTAVRTMDLGAFAFFEKPFDGSELVAQVRKALHESAERHRQREHSKGVKARMAKLTRRERQVLDLVVAGHPNREIAAMLKVSSKTVEAHRSHMMQKLEVNNLASLLALVLKHPPNQHHED